LVLLPCQETSSESETTSPQGPGIPNKVDFPLPRAKKNSSSGLDGGSYVIECGLESLAEGGEDENDDDCDQRNQKSVFDQGLSVFVLQK